jgi:spore maturation protein CgeB
MLRVFYDLDTPVTLARLRSGKPVDYLPEDGLQGFDLTLSYTGGDALHELQTVVGARRVAALYGHVDPAAHRPVSCAEPNRADLSYLGTYAADRQPTLERLFIEPARLHPARRFTVGGSGYPAHFPWTPNIFFVHHVAPSQHPAFFCSSRLTLNVTRADMAAMGFCPSGRLFEAASCGVALLSDSWIGMEEFFTPDREILIARTPEQVSAALQLSDLELERIAQAARERVCAEHTSLHRAQQLLGLLEAAREGGGAGFPGAGLPGTLPPYRAPGAFAEPAKVT